MIRVSLAWISDAVGAVRDLKSIDQGTPTIKCFMAILNAQMKLDEVYQSSIYTPHLRASVAQADMLRNSLSEIGERISKDFSVPMSQNDRVALTSGANTFLNILNSELGVIPAFLVTPKEGYDLNSLAEGGDRLFPSAIVKKVSDVIPDMLEAGKALAFDLPTASGFHVFRVLESVLKAYWDHISGGASRPKLETIGSYAKELQNSKYGDERVWETLAQITKLHRNPLIHPEVILTTDQAIEIIGIARSAIGAMLRAMPDLPSTTSNPQQNP